AFYCVHAARRSVSVRWVSAQVLVFNDHSGQTTPLNPFFELSNGTREAKLSTRIAASVAYSQNLESQSDRPLQSWTFAPVHPVRTASEPAQSQCIRENVWIDSIVAVECRNLPTWQRHFGFSRVATNPDFTSWMASGLKTNVQRPDQCRRRQIVKAGLDPNTHSLQSAGTSSSPH